MLNLEMVIEGFHLHNLTNMLVKSLVTYGPFKHDIAFKFGCFGVDGAIDLIRAIIQLNVKHIPCVVNVHDTLY
jgi:hypothetical protein